MLFRYSRAGNRKTECTCFVLRVPVASGVGWGVQGDYCLGVEGLSIAAEDIAIKRTVCK